MVIFNPHAFPVRSTVSMRINARRMTDDKGNEIPFQLTRGEFINRHDKFTVTFPVDVPAFGYRVYRAFPSGEQQTEFPSVYADEHSLENGLIRVEFDSQSGDIRRIYDKKADSFIWDGVGGAIFTDETDCDTWAHAKRDLGEECGRFGKPDFKVLEAGSVRAILRVRTVCENSVLTRYYTLSVNSDEVRVTAEADIRDPHRALKLLFPAKKEIICEIPYGKVTRPLDNGEDPFGKWLASGSLCVANTGIHGYDSTQTHIRMTALRSAIYADHFGFEHRDEYCSYMERGPRRFTYSVFAYEGAADAHRRAALLGSPLRAVNETFHHGPLGERFCGFEGCPENAIVTAVKQAEDGDGIIVRYQETEGKEGKLAAERCRIERAEQ